MLVESCVTARKVNLYLTQGTCMLTSIYLMSIKGLALENYKNSIIFKIYSL